MIGHPRRSALLAWLDGGNPAVGAHLDSCARCARLLDDATPLAPGISELLRASLAPPDDLQLRLQSGIARKLQTREDLRLLVEMLGVPLQTIRLMGQPGRENS